MESNKYIKLILDAKATINIDVKIVEEAMKNPNFPCDRNPPDDNEQNNLIKSKMIPFPSSLGPFDNSNVIM